MYGTILVDIATTGEVPLNNCKYVHIILIINKLQDL